MEEGVALVVVGARVVGGNDLALGVEVARVEELEVLVAELAARREVPLDVVELAEPPAEGDMGVVCQTGAAEDDEAVLCQD